MFKKGIKIKDIIGFTDLSKKQLLNLKDNMNKEN